MDHQVPDEPRKYYIGVHTSKKGNLPEEDPYLGSSKPLTAFLKEHPEAVVTKTILAYFLTRDYAVDHEIELHNEFDVGKNPEYFNQAKQTSTGFCVAGTTHSEETRQKMSEAKKDYYANPENAEAIAEANKKRSDWHKNPENAEAIAEVNMRISEANKAWYRNPYNAAAIAERNRKTGDTVSDYYKNPENAEAIAERHRKIGYAVGDYYKNPSNFHHDEAARVQKILDYRNNPSNAEAIKNANKKNSEAKKAWYRNPDNAAAIAERNRKMSEIMKEKPSPKKGMLYPPTVCRVSDQKEYRKCDIARWGLEKLCLVDTRFDLPYPTWIFQNKLKVA